MKNLVFKFYENVDIVEKKIILSKKILESKGCNLLSWNFNNRVVSFTCTGKVDFLKDFFPEMFCDWSVEVLNFNYSKYTITIKDVEKLKEYLQKEEIIGLSRQIGVQPTIKNNKIYFSVPSLLNSIPFRDQELFQITIRFFGEGYSKILSNGGKASDIIIKHSKLSPILQSIKKQGNTLKIKFSPFMIEKISLWEKRGDCSQFVLEIDDKVYGIFPVNKKISMQELPLSKNEDISKVKKISNFISSYCQLPIYFIEESKIDNFIEKLIIFLLLLIFILIFIYLKRKKYALLFLISSLIPLYRFGFSQYSCIVLTISGLMGTLSSKELLQNKALKFLLVFCQVILFILKDILDFQSYFIIVIFIEIINVYLINLLCNILFFD